MLTIKEFESLINSQESSILDFKSEMYNFSDDTGVAKFVKDTICFSNTIRNDTSFIIIGIGEKDDKTKDLIGVSAVPDDSMLQDKVKDKANPRPNFAFYSMHYQNKVFGVFEFPITKYSLPISPTIKMRGLEIGRVYFRRGTTNAEAIGHEVITIHDWLRGLPEKNINGSLYDEIADLMKRLTSGVERLSVVLVDMLRTAKRHELDELIKFCSSEIQGLDVKKIDSSIDEYQYRVQIVRMSIENIEINPYSAIRPTESLIKQEMDKNDNFHEVRLFFPEPINVIEGNIERYNAETICLTAQVSSKQIFKDKKGSDYPVYIYVFKDSHLSLYRNIRQKSIDKLIAL